MSTIQDRSVTALAGDLTLRSCTTADFPEFYRHCASTFVYDVSEFSQQAEAGSFDPSRSFVITDRDRIVGSITSSPRQITVPGATVPLATSFAAAVAPTHRRRGIYTTVMRHQLTELRERGTEPLLGGWPSGGTLLDRFGWGPATQRGIMTGAARNMKFRAAPRDDLMLTELPLAEARELMQTIYDQAWSHHTGWLDRSPAAWDRGLQVTTQPSTEPSARRVVVCHNTTGTPSGYARYSITCKWPIDPEYECHVEEVVALDPPTYAQLWRHLTSLDLVATVHQPYAPADHALRHLLVDPRSINLSVRDGLWLRLVDVGQALSLRRYATDVDLVIAVRDHFAPWNNGRWHLTGGATSAACERTHAAPHIAISVNDLAAAYLGAPVLDSLVTAGAIEELHPGAVDQVTRAFAAAVPYCPEYF